MVATLARVDTVPMVPASQGEAGSRVAAQATVRDVHGSSCRAGWVAQCYLMRCQLVRHVDAGITSMTAAFWTGSQARSSQCMGSSKAHCALLDRCKEDTSTLAAHKVLPIKQA